jgi:hypothetical protein
VTGEQDERLTVPGPRGPQGRQGNQGNRGEQGTSGLSRSVRRALVFMFGLAVILAAFGLFWINHAVHDSQAAIQEAQHREQVMQQQAGTVLEEKLCTTFGKLAALRPPPGNPKTNPSRAYLQAEHATLTQLGTDLGCKSKET